MVRSGAAAVRRRRRPSWRWRQLRASCQSALVERLEGLATTLHVQLHASTRSGRGDPDPGTANQSVPTACDPMNSPSTASARNDTMSGRWPVDVARRHVRLPRAGRRFRSRCTRTRSDRAIVTDRKPPRATGDDRATLVALLQSISASRLCGKVMHRMWTGDDHRCRLVHRFSGWSSIWHTLRRCGFSNASPASRSSVTSSTTTSVRTTRSQQPWLATAPCGHASTLSSPRLISTPCVPVSTRRPTPICGGSYAHLLEETARHAGHADILRELIDGQTGR